MGAPDAYQYSGKHLSDVKRKGNKVSRKVFMTPEAREALDGYLEHEREEGPGALFQSRTGRRLHRTTVQDVLGAIRNQANSQLPEDERFTFSPHTLRHTFLREMACTHCKRRSKSAPGGGPKVRHPGSGISRLAAGVNSLLQSVV